MLDTSSINEPNRYKETRLHLAASAMDLRAIHELLTHGADVTLRDEEEKLPVERLFYYRIKFLKLPLTTDEMNILENFIFSSPLDPLPSNIADLLAIAAHINHRAILERFKQKGVSFFRIQSKLPNMMEIAAWYGHLDLLAWLLTLLEEENADTIIQSALFGAVTNLFADGAELLITRGKVDLHHYNETLLNTFIQCIQEKKFTDKTYVQKSLATLEVLFRHGYRFEQRNKFGLLPLDYWLTRPDPQHYWPWIEWYIEKIAIFPEKNTNLFPLIKLAIEQQNKNIIAQIFNLILPKDLYAELLSYGAVVTIQLGNVDMLSYLKHLGLDLNRPIYYLSYDHHCKHLWDYIYRFSQQLSSQSSIKSDIRLMRIQHSHFIRYMIDHGAELHLPRNDSPLLHYVAAMGYTELVRLLLAPQYGFKVDLINRYSQNNKTALQIAIQYGQVETVEVLLQQGANPNLSPIGFFSDQQRPIHHAAKYKEKSIANQLLTCLLNYKAEVDLMLLHILIERDIDAEIIAACLNQLDKHIIIQSNLLHTAVSMNNLSACKILLAYCPELLTMQDANGCTPLHLVTVPGREEFFHYFLTQGAPLTACDYAGYSVIAYAIMHHTFENLALSAPDDFNIAEFCSLRSHTYARLNLTIISKPTYLS